MRTPAKHLAAALTVSLALASAAPAEAGLTRISGPNFVYTEVGTINKFDAAFDSSHQVYLLAWGRSQAWPAVGQLLDAAGLPMGGPFQISDGSLQAGWARVIYSPEEGKFLVSYTKILAPGRHQRIARFATYQSGALSLGPEIIIDTWTGGAGEASGMAYSRGRFLVTWWNWDADPTFPQTFVTILNSSGGILVSKKQITLSGDGETDPEIACDQARGRCLVVGQAWGTFNGGTPATWSTVIADDSAQTLKPISYAHVGPIEKEPTVAYSVAGDRFIIAFSNSQNTILALTLEGGSLSFNPAYVVRQPTDDPSAVGFGRPRLAYNATTQSTIVAIKPWVARTGALELDSAGGIVPGTWQMTPQVTSFSQGTQELAQAADPANGRFLVADQQGYLTVRASVFAAAPGTGAVSAPRKKTKGDRDGDGIADLTFFRPSDGTWYTLNSSKQFTYALADTASYSTTAFGTAGDVPVPADYDGDGKIDAAFYRANTADPNGGCTWFVKYSSLAANAPYSTTNWGFCTDTPVPADFDGDGKADPTVYRKSTGRWYVLLSSGGFTTWINLKWGLAPSDGYVGQDSPVPGDYDGDGKADFAVYRPMTGVWYVLLSSTGWNSWITMKWGIDTGNIPGDYVGDGNPDVPVAADYDGDGKTDIAVFRAATGDWFVLHSSTGYGTYSVQRWGVPGDVPVPADYDGDGRSDVSVYRPSTGRWYIARPGKSNWYIDWGVTGDLPIK